MRILEETYRHPIRADGITLAVFQREGGYLSTESRDGVVTVLATLGSFDSRQAALARTAARSLELLRQGYLKIAAR